VDAIALLIALKQTGSDVLQKEQIGSIRTRMKFGDAGMGATAFERASVAAQDNCDMLGGKCRI
jgi:hypothetical protein